MNVRSHEERVEMLKQNVIVPYNSQGIYNWQYSRFIGWISSKFSSESWFVGVIPAWSQVKWYSTEQSDFDVIFLWGKSEYDTSLQTMINEWSLEKFGRPAGMSHIYPESLMIWSETDEEIPLALRLSLLARPIIWNREKIIKLRRTVRRAIMWINRLQEYKIKGTYYCLEDDFWAQPGNIYSEQWDFTCPWHILDVQEGRSNEGKTLSKMLAGGFIREEIDAIFEARKNLWRGRIQHLIDGTGPFSDVQ